MSSNPSFRGERGASSRLSLRRLLVSIVLVLAVPVLIDAALFRFRLYQYVIEPESTAGMVSLAPFFVNPVYIPGERNVLVVGDSRVGEGFSSQVANNVAKAAGINFIGLGIPGTTPRVWHYILREIDPDRNRFDTIVLVLWTLRDDETLEDIGNRGLDTAYLTPILRFSDLWEYSRSFTSPEERRKALLSVLFPPVALQKDIEGFLASPLKRYLKSRLWRESMYSWGAAYQGRSERMPDIPGMQLASTNLDTSALPKEHNQEIAQYLASIQYLASAKSQPSVSSSLTTRTRGYFNRWIGAIANRYQGTQTKIVISLLPRGPYHGVLCPVALSSEPMLEPDIMQDVTILPPGFATSLERPQFFFDTLHLNAQGRIAFSQGLARTFLEQISSR